MSKPNFLFFLAVGVSSVNLACAPEAPPGFTEADRAELAATTNEALDIANTSKDWNRYVEVYYAPDAVVMPSNMEVVRGRDAIAAFLGGFPSFTEFRSSHVEVDGVGDIAYVWGTFSMNVLVAETHESIPDRGKFIEIWRRQPDGRWLITHDIFNSDMPLPVQ